MARIGVVWSAAARRVADAAVAMGMFALVAAFVVSGAREARAQGVTGWGSESFRNVDGLDGNVVKVAAGERHTVALKADGAVACWGNNGYGQCDVPAGLGTIIAVAAGGYHTVALKADGSVACWGRNDYGQSSVPAGL